MSPERLEQFEKDALLHKLQDENDILKEKLKSALKTCSMYNYWDIQSTRHTLYKVKDILGK